MDSNPTPFSSDAPDPDGPEARWAGVEEKALLALDRAERLEPRRPLEGWRPVLRLWRHPADDDRSSWTILVPSDGSWPARLRVRQVTWRRPHDRTRTFDPRVGLAHAAESIPSLEILDFGVATDRARPLLDRLASLPSPGFEAERPVAEGGEARGIAEVGGREIRLAWWGEGPEPWRPFVEIALRLGELVEPR